MVDFSKEYELVKQGYGDFLKEMTVTIEKTLIVEEIPVAFAISGRLKKIDSIQEKHDSGRKIIKKSITELNDLVGIRVVVLFPEYKEQVEKLLEEEFSVKKKDVHKHDAKTFDYTSTHLILKAKKKWLTTPNWRDHKDKKIEVQIRTLSEHVWAETSHSLFYKSENAPKTMERDLSKLKALLEVVDEKMQQIKIMRDAHNKKVRGLSYKDVLKMDLNPETFRRVMRYHSNKQYDLSKRRNKELSAEVESRFNILTAQLLHDILSFWKLRDKTMRQDDFIGKVVFGQEKRNIKIAESIQKEVNN